MAQTTPGTGEAGRRVGLEFTERMSGFIGPATESWDRAAVLGRECGETLEFTVTVATDELDRFLSNPSHKANLTGCVTAPRLSPHPLQIERGTFNLFIDDPSSVNTRKLVYEMTLAAADSDGGTGGGATAGARFFISGFKTVRDDPGFDVWADTTTLRISVYRGASELVGELLFKGVLRLTPADLARELTTIRITNAAGPLQRLEAIAKFGRFFAGKLFDTYGGIFKRPNIFNPDAPARAKRPLKVSPPEVHTVLTDDGLSLRLTRYRGGGKGPVLLVHGLGVSSLIFAMDTIETTLLEYLFGHGYDVWLLDYRSSIELPYATQAYTADDVAKKDYPAAVRFVREQTKSDTIQCVVHCFGASTFFMAMLAGLQGVRSAAVSQIGIHARVPLATNIKALLHAPDVLAAIGVTEMNARVDNHESLMGRLADAVLKFYPVSGGPRDTSPVSRRISFIYGQLYEIDQLNDATYNNLHEMFGIAAIKSLQHLTTIIRAGKVVAADGSDEYVAEDQGYPHIGRLKIPMLIVQGEENQCWLPESTRLTVDLLREKNGDGLYERRLIPRYGHIDCIFGKDAARDVYPHFLSHLEKTALA